MGRAKKIQDRNFWYDFLRYYVDLALHLSYRNIKYVGRETIPTDGAVIYAPNHTNALMDALVILAMDRKPKVFVARADIFKNPTLAKIFNFLKIMPIMRMRDGYEEVKKNNETIEKAVDVLRDKIPFCIFPEGTHQAKYSTLPLSKGIFRIAFQSQSLMPDTPLYIIPIGMRYGNFFRFRSTVRVQVGEAINVGEFIAQHADLAQAEQINLMKELLDERMKQSIFYIPNDENYDATYEICAAVVKMQVRHLKSDAEMGKLRGLDAHFAANNMTVKHMAYIKAHNPELSEELLRLGREAAEIRKRNRISLSSVSVKYAILSRMLKILFFILTLPYCIPVAILTLPLHGICAMLFRVLKDYAFRNSVRYLVNLVVWPILMIIYSVLAYVFLPWQWALPLTIALLPAPIVAQESYRLLRLFFSDIRLWRNRELRAKYHEIRRIIFSK